MPSKFLWRQYQQSAVEMIYCVVAVQCVKDNMSCWQHQRFLRQTCRYIAGASTVSSQTFFRFTFLSCRAVTLSNNNNRSTVMNSYNTKTTLLSQPYKCYQNCCSGRNHCYSIIIVVTINAAALGKWQTVGMGCHSTRHVCRLT